MESKYRFANEPPPFSLSYALAHHLNILEPPLQKDALRQVWNEFFWFWSPLLSLLRNGHGLSFELVNVRPVSQNYIFQRTNCKICHKINLKCFSKLSYMYLMIIIRLFEILLHRNACLKTKLNMAAAYFLLRKSNFIQRERIFKFWTSTSLDL